MNRLSSIMDVSSERSLQDGLAPLHIFSAVPSQPLSADAELVSGISERLC